MKICFTVDNYGLVGIVSNVCEWDKSVGSENLLPVNLREGIWYKTGASNLITTTYYVDLDIVIINKFNTLFDNHLKEAIVIRRDQLIDNLL